MLLMPGKDLFAQFESSLLQKLLHFLSFSPEIIDGIG
jgi:hypothetical protein